MNKLFAAAFGLGVLTAALALEVAAAESNIFPAEDMIVLSGVDQSIEAYRPLLRSALREGKQVKDQAFIAYWESLADRMFDPAALTTSIADAIAGKFTAEQQAALKDFYTSDLGREITFIENDSIGRTDADRLLSIREGRKSLADASDQRKELLKTMASFVEGHAQNALERQAIMAIMGGIYVGQHLGGDIEIPWEELTPQIDKMMAVSRVAESAVRLPRIAYTYRSVSDDDLTAYIAFLNSEAGLHFYAVLTEAMTRVVSDEVIRFGKALASNPNRPQA
jgi:hypothetical protein